MSFKRSTHCDASGACVEVERPSGTAVAEPEKSSPTDSGCDPSSPVYARVRSTKDSSVVLEFDRGEWDAFVAGVKAGEFD